MRTMILASSVVLALGLYGCGSDEPVTMPDVTGEKLDVAYDRIQDAGFDDKDKVRIEGGGMFGVVVEDNWTVCSQSPSAGATVEGEPELTVDRSCAEEKQPDASPESPDAPESTTTPSSSDSPKAAPEPKAAKISVDELFDRLNAGGTEVGERFRFTGVLVASELWGVGATGDFSVLVEAKDGTNDLMIFIDEDQARGWSDGTRVEFVVEDTEATIEGETSGGWLKAVSAQER